MNLDELELVPFETKALTRDGRRLIYIGKRGRATLGGTPQYPYHFALKDPGDTNPMLTFTRGGSEQLGVGNTPNDIVRIIQKWVPREGDVVKIEGQLIVIDRFGALNDYIRSTRNSDHNYVVVAETNTPGFFKLQREGGRLFYEVSRNSMRLLRRP